MALPAPTIDHRDIEAILKEARALAPFYTPEWTATEETGAGAALLHIFARLYEGLIRRLNDVPQKQFLAFLDMLDLKLLPVQPARAPLTFFLSTGAKEPVEIPARTQGAATPTEGGNPIIFETEKAILATPAILTAVFSVVPAQDHLFDHSTDLLGSATAKLFMDAGKNRQEHSLYLGHEELFTIKSPVRIELTISPPPSNKLEKQSGLVRWEYYGEQEQTIQGERVKVLDWHPFDGARIEQEQLVLLKRNIDEITPVEIDGSKSRWIRCTVKPTKIEAVQDVVINTIQVKVLPLTEENDSGVGVLPDAAFYNDVPIDFGTLEETKTFYPFGQRPRLFDTFYLASQDAFSKKGASITLHVANSREPATEEPEPTLSWEYWDGKGWKALRLTTDSTDRFLNPGQNTITFTVPEQMETVEVGGQENYWLRVRLINGDYGKEVFSVSNQGIVTSTLHFTHPELKLAIHYAPPVAFLDHCVTFNNQEYADQTESSKTDGKRFKPFLAMDDQYQALYLGFNQAPLKGPISIFFSLEEQEYTEENRPRIAWEYFRKRTGAAAGEWTRLAVTDGTNNLTESGTAEFIGPSDFAQRSRFGQLLYWIRAVDMEDTFQAQTQSTATVQSSRRGSPSNPTTSAKLPPCPERLELFHPSFSRTDRDTAPAPQVKGLYLNTVWAIQAETVQDEILGSSTGIADQTFTLAKFPVIEEEIWVNEFGTLTESERKTLIENTEIDKEEVQDAEGNVIAFWIRWLPVDDFTEAKETDRVYTIDHTFGQIKFGNGVQGMVPPIGRDNITATYRAGGGTQGNVGASQITGLRTTIPFVESIHNPEPAGGGSDTEPVESVLERGPQMIKHRDRAVTAEDFEWLTRETSQAIARVKCLPTFNDQGIFETNWVTVIIVPESTETRPMPSPQLRTRVEQYLRERSANVTVFPTHIQVTGPTYIEVNVTADLFPLTIDLAPSVETEALNQLAQFLHPLTGGYEGSGWEFGRLPCLSDVYALLEGIEGMDHVENLSMTLQSVTPTGVPVGEPQSVTEDQPLDIRAPEYTLIYSGNHSLTVKTLR